jgi:sec-independent protein translocase protein TatA
MGELRPWHIAVLVVVVIVLFGAKRLPGAARSLGQSMRILKAETAGLREDGAAEGGKGTDEAGKAAIDHEPVRASTLDEVEDDHPTIGIRRR